MIQVNTKQPKSVGYQKQLKSQSCSLARRVNTIGRLESAKIKSKDPTDVLTPSGKHYYVFQGWTTRYTYTERTCAATLYCTF